VNLSGDIYLSSNGFKLSSCSLVSINFFTILSKICPAMFISSSQDGCIIQDETERKLKDFRENVKKL
jgi:hypothetical protein